MGQTAGFAAGLLFSDSLLESTAEQAAHHAAAVGFYQVESL